MSYPQGWRCAKSTLSLFRSHSHSYSCETTRTTCSAVFLVIFWCITRIHELSHIRGDLFSQKVVNVQTMNLNGLSNFINYGGLALKVLLRRGIHFRDNDRWKKGTSLKFKENNRKGERFEREIERERGLCKDELERRNRSSEILDARIVVGRGARSSCHAMLYPIRINIYEGRSLVNLRIYLPTGKYDAIEQQISINGIPYGAFVTFWYVYISQSWETKCIFDTTVKCKHEQCTMVIYEKHYLRLCHIHFWKSI